MRKLALLAAAVAQVTPLPIVQLVGQTTPDSVQLGLTLNKESGSMPSRITWTLPAGVKVSGAGFKRCPPRRAAQLACPAGSLVGTGRMTTVIGDTDVPTNYELGVHANGPHKLTFALRSDDLEAEQRVVVRGRTLTLDVPRSMRRDAVLTNFRLILGPAARGDREFVGVRRCRKEREYAVSLRLDDENVGTTATSEC